MEEAIKRPTQEDLIIELLKNGWFSNFGMQIILKSSSADRAFRRAREKGLEGYKFLKRVKENAPVRCYEYHIEKEEK